MTENYGGLKNAYVLIGKETTWGTAVSPTKDVGIVTDANVTATNEVISSRGLSSRSLDLLQMGQFRFRLDITNQFQHGRWIEYALGTKASATGSDPYVHGFTEGDNLPSCTVEIGLDGTTDDAETYEGCMMNSYTLALDLGGVVTERAELMAETVVTSASAETAVTDTLPTLSSHVATFKTGTAASEVAVAQCRAFEWTVNNNLMPVDKFGSFLVQDLVEGPRDYSLRATLAFTDTNERSKFFAGVNSKTAPTTADFAGFSTVIEADDAANSRRITMTLTDCHYTEYGRPISVGGVILQEIFRQFTIAASRTTQSETPRVRNITTVPKHGAHLVITPRRNSAPI